MLVEEELGLKLVPLKLACLAFLERHLPSKFPKVQMELTCLGSRPPLPLAISLSILSIWLLKVPLLNLEPIQRLFQAAQIR